MTRPPDAFPIPEVNPPVTGRPLRLTRRPHVERDGAVAGWRTLQGGRAVFPWAFLALWTGFSLLPDAHVAFRIPATIALAALAGVGAELCAGAGPRRGLARGTLWIIPAGATLLTVTLLVALGEPPAPAAPLLAGAVVATIGLQVLEVRGARGNVGWARPLNLAAAFALALGVFVAAPTLPAVPAAAGYAAAGALASVVVLRGSGGSFRLTAVFVGLSAAVITELGLMLQEHRPLFVAAGVPLLGLYIVSSTAQAILERAPRRAYVEVAIAAALAAIAGLALGRR